MTNYTFQSVLYKPRKGKKAWALKADFLKQLRAQLEDISDNDKFNAIAVPIAEVKRAMTQQTDANPRSIALQITRKYEDIIATYNPKEAKNVIVFRSR